MPDLKPHLRVMTWNVHACVGTDRRHDVDRVGRAVRDLAPDIAAFQEVDSRRPAAGAGKVYDLLRAEVGDHGHDAWAISGADGHYGQILASRFPLEEKQVHDISTPGREPRKAMSARIRLPTTCLRVVATHLGLNRHERRRQLVALQEIVAADLSTPVLLLGDFNEWFWPQRRQRDVFALFGAWTREASFPARFPLFALDRICCRPGALLARSWAAYEARAASDHLPIVAELALPALR
ncbi:MAG: endonuclease/exonuclease/phosphatase family protein [Kiloniellaceae bacterium]